MTSPRHTCSHVVVPPPPSLSCAPAPSRVWGACVGAPEEMSVPRGWVLDKNKPEVETNNSSQNKRTPHFRELFVVLVHRVTCEPGYLFVFNF